MTDTPSLFGPVPDRVEVAYDVAGERRLLQGAPPPFRDEAERDEAVQRASDAIEQRWTAPVSGTYLFEAGREPRLLSDEEAAAFVEQASGAQVIRFEVDEYETRGFQNSGGNLQLPVGPEALNRMITIAVDWP